MFLVVLILQQESIMINGWTYNKNDFVNIKDIISKYSSLRKLMTFFLH